MTRTPPPPADDAHAPASGPRSAREVAPSATPERPRAPIEVALDTAGLKIISLDDYADGSPATPCSTSH